MPILEQPDFDLMINEVLIPGTGFETPWTQDPRFLVTPELRDLSVWHNESPCQLSSNFNWNALEPFVQRFCEIWVQSPFRHRCGAEVEFSDDLSFPSGAYPANVNRLDANRLSLTWNYIETVAGNCAVDLSDVPEQIRKTLAGVVHKANRTEDLQLVKFVKCDKGQTGLMLEFNHCYPEQRSSPSSGTHLFKSQNAPFWAAHNTDFTGAIRIMHDQMLRPSNFMLNDNKWLPSRSFYARGHPHSEEEAVRSASKFGGIHSSRPICVMAKIGMRQLQHFSISHGGVPADGIASHFVDAYRSKDKRYGFRSSSALPVGLAIFWPATM